MGRLYDKILKLKQDVSQIDNSGKMVPSVAHVGTARSAPMVPTVFEVQPKA